ncbi:acetyltransferase [Arthrospiribacter ruber]|uniref:Acetyltransferase n=1 Tax=Arthrospiribacter ruber TaxID=2487934 RepID=A0A951IUQ5_9BACT|nr:acetyltransferase [Arthrospiribacter ruber]MBW3466426.1 acetyltransferase [Arthrospiribacter ruber]
MVIVGASGHGKVIFEIVKGREPVEAFYDDSPPCQFLFDVPVKKLDIELWTKKKAGIVAIGDNSSRERIVKRIGNKMDFVNIIHDSAIVSAYAQIGEGCVMMERSILKVGSELGNHVIVNTAASIDHDCILGDFVHIAPGAILCGGVYIGKGTLVGAGSVLLPGIKIGSRVVIGAGSVVHKDISDGLKWIGHGLAT